MTDELDQDPRLTEETTTTDPVEGELLPATGTGVVVADNPPPPGREVLMPMETEQVIAGMDAYQAMLPKLLDPNDYQQAGRDRRFVKKSGWRKIARAFNLSVTIVSMHVERDHDGNAVRAECVARAAAPNGQVSDGDGYCAADEKRFEDSGGKQKLENDLRTTATTRAKNRAISDLVGMGEVSAEEMDTTSGPTVQPTDADEDLKRNASEALTMLVGDIEAARNVWGAVKSANGNVLPVAVAEAWIAARAAQVPGGPPPEVAAEQQLSAEKAADDPAE